MATRPPMAPPVNETTHTVSRITREGKKITYKLKVMQQPDRARACGAGAKSSADRRPVDPPPVVELLIYEADANNPDIGNDITISYNANFFLFATLESARPIAQGRLGPPVAAPVLTGVPVAGVAYLDRPDPAGYFIFPDLSVRHEGLYRLDFHLYEETKEEKDKDASEPTPIQNSLSSKPTKPKSSLAFRLNVVSVPFNVYSAKKFPGLTTSTNLSRTIAEQGCRVRIRRDVRMRRRGDKWQEGYDDNYATTPAERPRSTSISTVDHTFPYGLEAQRRPSATEFGFQGAPTYQRHMSSAPTPASSTTPIPSAAAVPPPPPPMGHSYASHLSFGSTQAQYSAPQLPRTPQSATTPLYSPRPSISHGRNSSIGTEYEPVSANYPYPPSRIPNKRTGCSKAALPPLRLEPPKATSMQPSAQPRSSDPNAYQSMTPHAAPRSQTPNLAPSLPPLKALSGEYTNNALPPSGGTSQSPVHESAPGKRLLWETGPSLSKRSYGDSFGQDERPLYNGMRPDTELYHNTGSRSSSEASRIAFYTDTGDEMAYKRANGRMATKISPALQ